VYVSHLIPMLNDAKRLGEKTGAGFYKVGIWWEFGGWGGLGGFGGLRGVGGILGEVGVLQVLLGLGV
jgi:hypothetical protein